MSDGVLTATPADGGAAIAPVEVDRAGYRVRPLLDGYFTMSLGELVGVGSNEIAAVQAGAGLAADAVDLPVFAFLLTGHGRTILIDAGTVHGMMASLGRLPEALAASGTALAAVDAVLITHLHPDHVGGIARADGTALFPNAQVYIGRVEWDYWHNPARATEPAAHTRYILASLQQALAPYPGRIRLFDDGSTVAPGIVARALPGHTFGHSGFALGDDILFWGDALHLVPLQLRCPQCALGYDHDPVLSEATRRRVFAEVAGSRMMLAGAHLPAPGMGRIALNDGQWCFTPLAADETTGSTHHG